MPNNSLFYIDFFAVVMLGLIATVTLIVLVFSQRYLEGDRLQRLFMQRVIMAAGCAAIMATANHLWLLWGAWLGGNWLLTRLMIHKPEWQAARMAGSMAWQHLLVGSVLLAAGFAALHYMTGTPYLQEILKNGSMNNIIAVMALFCLLLAAMIQSAIWPMQDWLLNSLNTPTPASALMHAGLINAGGFLLLRFAPLLLAQPHMLQLLFVLGIITTLYATAIKLVQSDIKRMLACSTMAQMGYMLMQCGLGLFPAALMHILCHGLFKAGLFLGAGAAIENNTERRPVRAGILSLLTALTGGMGGAVIFAWAAGIPLNETMDSRGVVIGFVMLALAQMLLTLQRQPFSTLAKLSLIILLIPTLSACYGGMYYMAEIILAPQIVSAPLPLNMLHVLGLSATFIAWLWLNRLSEFSFAGYFYSRGYVTLLNAGQPHSSAVTAHRNHYTF